MVKFSIVIPAYNEAEYLDETLRALRNQTIKNYEIIVKDGSSRDQTVKVAKQLADKVISNHDSSIGDARNQGAKYAEGEVLVFVDADSLLPPETLERFNKLLDEENVVGGSCRKVPASGSFLDKFFYEFINLSTYISSLLSLGGAHGNCMVIKKRVFQQIGGFNPKIIVAEEQDLVRKALKFGKIVFLLDTFVLENPRRLRKWGKLRLYKAWFLGMYRSFKAGNQVYEKVR
jgi:glycosyltransferase involved in cell wall biosynthesis